MDTVLGVLCPAELGGVSCCELFFTIDINSLSSLPHVILERVSAANFQLRTFQNVFDLLLELTSRCYHN